MRAREGEFEMENRVIGSIRGSIIGSIKGSTIGSTLAVVAMLVLALGLFAQAPRQSGRAGAPVPSPTPDLSGVWQSQPPGGERHHFMTEPAPMQPWALEKFEYAKNPTVPMGRGRDELEPRYNCFPPGPTGLMLNPLPFEIIQSPRRVMIFHEHDHWIRQIWMDGREHPDGFPITWMGHSIGKWDGDTLVVDTVKINEKSSWIDRAGTPHSNELRVAERFRRPTHDTLEVEFLFEDPKAYTKPWGGKKVYRLGEGWEIQEHVVCEELLLQKRGF